MLMVIVEGRKIDLAMLVTFTYAEKTIQWNDCKIYKR